MDKKKIRIAIDGNEANVAQRVGSNAYAYEILKALEKMTREESENYISEKYEIECTVVLSSPPQQDLPPERKGWKYQHFGPGSFWTQWALPWHLFWHQKDYDVFFTPGHYGPRVSPIPYISSVMDLAFLHFPKQFRKKDYLQLKEWTRYSVKHAKKVVVISEFTRDDVMKQYHVPKEKIVVAYPGIRPEDKMEFSGTKRRKTLHKLKIIHPYFLYVGTLQPRKNLLNLIEGFERFMVKYAYDEQYQLVIAGKIGWLADEILERVQQSPLKKKIVLTGYVTEAEKQILVQESLATILIGLYEGFGIPLLEAMAYGSIPIGSITSSLPEVVGAAGYQVDPQSIDEISKALRDVIHLTAKQRAQLLKEGRERCHRFSWEKSAKKILEAAVSLVEK